MQYLSSFHCCKKTKTALKQTVLISEQHPLMPELLSLVSWSWYTIKLGGGGAKSDLPCLLWTCGQGGFTRTGTKVRWTTEPCGACRVDSLGLVGFLHGHTTVSHHFTRITVDGRGSGYTWHWYTSNWKTWRKTLVFYSVLQSMQKSLVKKRVGPVEDEISKYVKNKN